MADSGDLPSLTSRMHWISGYAHAVARERGHTGAGAEHLQLAILDSPDSLPTQVLRRTGAHPEAITRTLDAAMRSISYRSPTTLTYRRFLTAAGDIAREFGHDRIDAEHLQLAILRDSGCVATRALGRVDISPDAFATALIAAMRG